VAAAHAARHDRDGTFPVEGLGSLRESGYLGLVVPSSFGGGDATVTEMVLGNLQLAHGDASLALVVAMHCALLGRVRDASAWPSSQFARVAEEVVATGGLINSLATESEMGSPSRGGLPATTAVAVDGGFVLNGRKTFSSGSSVLRWGVISAAVQTDAPYLSNFLVPMSSPGVRIEASWDSLGMRATCSHTVVLEDVRVPSSAELPRAAAAAGVPPYERAWSLCVSAVYLGVAEAARNYAASFARERKPTALGGKAIASLPSIRDRMARIDLLLYQARGLLVGLARAWDAAPSAPFEAALAAAKVTATNNAIAATDLAMRLVGGASMDRASPIERHYRDVRGGLHHPPQDDAALALFAREALDPRTE
jgi:alkylation response protein AidB-like acyl-CoA dehydrogenase